MKIWQKTNTISLWRFVKNTLWYFWIMQWFVSKKSFSFWPCWTYWNMKAVYLHEDFLPPWGHVFIDVALFFRQYQYHFQWKKKNLHSFGDGKIHSIPFSMSYSQHLFDRISAKLQEGSLSVFGLFLPIFCDLFWFMDNQNFA